jgi:flagellar motor protein MotB
VASADAGNAVEMHLPADATFTPWIHDPAALAEEAGDLTEIRDVVKQEAQTVKLEGLVPPIHFGLGEAQIPEDYLDLLREVLESMRDRSNVRLHFIGHADSLPLSDALVAKYGDNVGLSRERAGTTAEYCQQELNLPPESISYEGMGDSQPIADNETEAGRQQNRRVEVEVWYDEISEKTVEEEVNVHREVNRVKVCRTETVCKLRYEEGHSHRARVKNLVLPLHYEADNLEVPENFLTQIQQAMVNLNDRQNVVIKFIAYSDNQPLTGRDERIYGDQLGLSKAVARRVGLSVQEALGLPNTAIDSEGRGPSQPVAGNDSQQGRALNRRVEVEFWHDDPLQDLPDEPQICPDAAGAETVTRVYASPSGDIDPILFENGEPVVPAGYTDQLNRAMAEVGDKTNVRLRFVGYTGNRRLDRRTAAVYGDDIGLSMARARRAMAAVSQAMGLAPEQAEFDGHGYVQSDDVVNTGFIESDTSRVQVQVVYDEPMILDDYEGVEVTPITREVETVDPFALNLMRITVDGTPVDDPGKCSSDVQRCTDVALEEARIQFKLDSLDLQPRLNVTAWPRSIRYQDLAETDYAENRVRFRLYTNYHSFIEAAEVRIFEEAQSVRGTPLAVIPVDADGMAQWQPEFDSVSAPGLKFKYLLRVYDENGLFDETRPQPLWVVDSIDPAMAESDFDSELLAGYGETRIAFHNIPLAGGSVQARGTAIPEGHAVWMAGYAIPVDDQGRFVAEEILPDGLHTVEVAVLDTYGNGEMFLRDLSLKKSDWFTVAIADLTVAGNKTEGPAELLQPDNPQYSEDMDVQGRLAFYTNGKFESDWSLTASADTEEGPLDEIFSNFMDKSTEALFRRMDPDTHYPTFGDDATVTEDAPASGKFYLKAQKDETYGLWGNFKIGYTDTDLAHVDRGLYGANLHYQSLDTTGFGEPRLLLDGFAADPGTVAGRDEFRGTNGSLYYLSRQDILDGSESVRIEVRDKDSGLVLAVKNLTAALDYDLDNIQGRLLLAESLPATADDDLLVSSDSISGHAVYLVVRYEYTPGLTDPETLVSGGRFHYWLGDYVKIGLTASMEDAEEDEESLGGADLTLRKSAETWLKVEAGRSEGPGQETTTSDDGGYSFSESDAFDSDEIEASAYRADVSIGVKDLLKIGWGRLTFYGQELEAGYSASGLTTTQDQRQYGGTAQLPLTGRLGASAKVDSRSVDEGLETESGELDLDYRMGSHWTLSSGVSRDSRTDHSEEVAETQEEGERTDAVLQLKYDSRARWTTYGFGQETLEKSGNREDNGRFGIGGSLRITDRFNLTGEVSDGDQGAAGSLGTEHLYSDRTTLYLNYTVDNERNDNGVRARKGNMASGFRTRYSDSASVYLEEQYAHGDVPQGLTHAAGVALTPYDRFNFGADVDFGTLKDYETAAETKRTAVSVTGGCGFEMLKIASGVEYRVDDVEQTDGSFSETTYWLFKNNLEFRLSPDWRLIGKLNHAESESSGEESVSGDYTEAIMGFAYRPVANDRLNALFKYTYFYNVPGEDSDGDYLQRSHIWAGDVMYDLTSRWTLGGKYAYRLSEVALDPEDPEYFDSRAHLFVLRADWHFVKRLDALLEARRLELPDAQDRRDGFLAAIYYHIGNHFKAGIGYNFCDFSDDLTDLDYRHQGLFFNLIGKI